MDKNELLRNYANKSDDELLALYEAETLLDVEHEALEDELYNRGIHVADRFTNPSDGPRTKSDAELTGLGGWLVLIALGVVIQPFYLLAVSIPNFTPVFSDGTWTLITDPESEFFNLGLAMLIGGEIAYNGALFLVMIYLAFLFFRRHRLFPRWFIGLQVSYIVVMLLDAAAVTAVLPGEPMFDEATAGGLARQIVYSSIWIPYMLSSRRVKLTFVRGKQEKEAARNHAAAAVPD